MHVLSTLLSINYHTKKNSMTNLEFIPTLDSGLDPDILHLNWDFTSKSRLNLDSRSRIRSNACSKTRPMIQLFIQNPILIFNLESDLKLDSNIQS